MVPFVISFLSQRFKFRLFEAINLLEVGWVLCHPGTLLEDVHMVQKILFAGKYFNIIHELRQRNAGEGVLNPEINVTLAIVSLWWWTGLNRLCFDIVVETDYLF